MPEAFKDKEEADFGQELMVWRIPARESYSRGQWWYIITGAALLAMVVYGIWVSNYLFVIIIVLFVAINVVNYFRPAEEIDFIITSEGVIIGNSFYDYDEIRNFSVIYKPREDLKALYLEFGSIMRPRLTIPLKDENPLQVRDHLLKYLKENLDRTDEPNTDYLAKRLKF